MSHVESVEPTSGFLNLAQYARGAKRESAQTASTVRCAMDVLIEDLEILSKKILTLQWKIKGEKNPAMLNLLNASLSLVQEEMENDILPTIATKYLHSELLNPHDPTNKTVENGKAKVTRV